ncbi:predicted protein [Plenodomus lingam JN3]|uniref:Predicted protein n=1 Tax=Leptosphaeria maculans (strain JN3 / isolate v23.1.3 / race Av1-4-5-6-7-8) TaxID=985895 RepID=E4ZSC4_LEPMJ|nr:predicted protein [Plenodomus lingam JN3]CBX94304.1 predicted protein [Plenodomus lingam JN3]
MRSLLSNTGPYEDTAHSFRSAFELFAGFALGKTFTWSYEGSTSLITGKLSVEGIH